MDVVVLALAKSYTDSAIAGTSGPLAGKSAYEIAVLNGYAGSEAEWLNSLQGKEARISDGGTWLIYNPTTDTYEDTGIVARGINGEDGTDGTDGTDGINAYVWIKYSNVEPTSNEDMQDTPAAWMGVYSGTQSTAPTNYTDYSWYKIKGENGSGGGSGVQSVNNINPVDGNVTISSQDINSSFTPVHYTISDTTITAHFGGIDAEIGNLLSSLDTKVDKVSGLGLSQENFTSALKTKYDGYEATIANKADTASVTSGLETKVDKVAGKDLSTNDLTDALLTKYDGYENDISTLTDSLAGKVDAVEGLGLSQENFTTALKTKYDAYEAEIAERATQDSVTASLATKVDKVTGMGLSANDLTDELFEKYEGYESQIAAKADSATVTTALDGKVDKQEGKQLSTNDFTNELKNKYDAYQTSIAAKANTTDVNTALSGKVNVEVGKGLSTNDYSNAEKQKVTTNTESITTLREEQTTQNQSISSLQEAVDSLNGAVIWIGNINLTTENVTQEALNARAQELGYTELRQGYSLNDLNGVEWRYNTSEAEWLNMGVPSIPIASDQVAGIVKSSTASMAVRVEAEGTMYLNGLTEAFDAKVDKEEGKGLSTNDFTDEQQQAVADNTANIATNTSAISDINERMSYVFGGEFDWT